MYANNLSTIGIGKINICSCHLGVEEVPVLGQEAVPGVHDLAGGPLLHGLEGGGGGVGGGGECLH